MISWQLQALIVDDRPLLKSSAWVDDITEHARRARDYVNEMLNFVIGSETSR